MIIKNLKIVTEDKVIDNGYLVIKDKVILSVNEGNYLESEDCFDASGLIALPGFIDVHLHGACGVDFMDADVNDYKNISNALYQEGVTSFLATTLTSDTESLKKVCETVKLAKQENPSLLGIHLEGPYISKKYKGAQNELYIRNPDINEIKMLNDFSGGNIRYITLAPEKEGAYDFIKEVSKLNIVCSVGHSEASFKEVETAIECGLTNVTHTHNAMSPHHHRNPGVVTASMYFDKLFCEVILDGIHVSEDTIKMFYKTIGSDRFMIVTDALKAKHSNITNFDLFGLPCIKKDGAAYLTSGPLAGSLLSMDQAIRNLNNFVKDLTLIDIAKVTSTNQAKSLKLTDRGLLKANLLADIVLLDEKYNVRHVFKEGKKVL